MGVWGQITEFGEQTHALNFACRWLYLTRAFQSFFFSISAVVSSILQRLQILDQVVDLSRCWTFGSTNCPKNCCTKLEGD
ncbi:hypothetical protein PM082_021804 [Marasmius tenuissimus]|nr:hypothetical protein PM082_021804 [Marasmius tenuissimus]